jgi:predicted RNA binding protein YcfA (HicA-like mRNA interferase family)
LTAAELIHILERGGWNVVRQKGSRQRFEHPEKPRNAVTEAVHAGRDLPEGTVRAILRRPGLSREEFEALRRG